MMSFKDSLIFDNKIILITGGTGSFGNAFLEKIIDTNFKEIRIFSRDEKKQDDMRKKYKDYRIKFYLGDVKDKESLYNAFFEVDYLFHAAALKQVPSCEFFPMEAVKTNILGTDNVLTVAINQGIKKVVCLSTDKAAYPINAMGISKALMEKVYIAKSKIVDPNKTMICGTRYGNVMASRGSVIPLFVNQLKSHQPLTITNPNMTRFLMSLDNAVDLVIKAFKEGEAGDLFVQKSSAATIKDLANALQRIFNVKEKIQIIGSRHGEKMYETLLTKEEYVNAVDMGEYYKVPADTRDLNYEKYFDNGDKNLDSERDYNSNNTYRLNINEIESILLDLPFIKDELKDWRN